MVWFYYWTVLTGGGFQQPGEEDYNNFLVRGWRQGQLHLSKEPSAAMRALADPYDPEQNGALRMGDASYYHGHYYLYFGATPAALVLMPYGILTGRELSASVVIFIFCSVGFLAASALWLAVRGRYFPGSAVWAGAAGVLVLGLGTHVLALQRRPLIWELPIAAGYAFTMLALLAIYAALHGRRPVLSMGLAGLSLGLAVGARPTCLLGAGLFLPALWHLRLRASDRSAWWRGGLVAAVAFSLCVAAVLVHNRVRFGEFLEFGQNYQLSGAYESKVQHFSPAYLGHNFRIYYFQSANWSGAFPFVEALQAKGGPAGYRDDWSEGVCGLAVTFPFLWMVCSLPFAWMTAGRGSGLHALVLAVAATYIGGSMAMLGYFIATPRYMVDFAPAFGLLACLGFLGLEHRARSAPWRGLFSIAAISLAVVTAVAGVLVSFDYHERLLSRTWPQVWEKMEAFFR